MINENVVSQPATGFIKLQRDAYKDVEVATAWINVAHITRFNNAMSNYDVDEEGVAHVRENNERVEIYFENQIHPIYFMGNRELVIQLIREAGHDKRI